MPHLAAGPTALQDLPDSAGPPAPGPGHQPAAWTHSRLPRSLARQPRARSESSIVPRLIRAQTDTQARPQRPTRRRGNLKAPTGGRASPALRWGLAPGAPTDSDYAEYNDGPPTDSDTRMARRCSAARGLRDAGRGASGGPSPLVAGKEARAPRRRDATHSSGDSEALLGETRTRPRRAGTGPGQRGGTRRRCYTPKSNGADR